MSFQIKFTDTAKEDLRNIATYIADQAKDKKVAINFVNELREKTKILESFPESGAIPDDRIMKNFDYRFLVHKEYLIFYHYISCIVCYDIFSAVKFKKNLFKFNRGIICDKLNYY